MLPSQPPPLPCLLLEPAMERGRQGRKHRKLARPPTAAVAAAAVAASGATDTAPNAAILATRAPSPTMMALMPAVTFVATKAVSNAAPTPEMIGAKGLRIRARSFKAPTSVIPTTAPISLRMGRNNFAVLMIDAKTGPNVSFSRVPN